MIRLAFVDDFRQRRDGAAAGLQFGEASDLIRQQPDKGAELLHQRGLDVRHCRYAYVRGGPGAAPHRFAGTVICGRWNKAIARAPRLVQPGPKDFYLG